MQASNIVNRFNKSEQQCPHCTSFFPTDQNVCHHCRNYPDDDFSKFKQALNQEQARAMWITRLVIGVSVITGLAFLLSI